MPKGTINKIQVDKPVFMTVVRECGSSIIKLGACTAIDCTERTIRRSLNEGKMTPCFLDQIARYLDVDSRLLSGELHRKAKSYSNDMLNSLVPVIRKHFNADAYGRKEMPNLEKVINDLENFREDHYLRIYAEDVLRKRFLETLPLGKTKADIYRMSAEELIDLDMDSRLVKW